MKTSCSISIHHFTRYRDPLALTFSEFRHLQVYFLLGVSSLFHKYSGFLQFQHSRIPDFKKQTQKFAFVGYLYGHYSAFLSISKEALVLLYFEESALLIAVIFGHSLLQCRGLSNCILLSS